VGTFESGNKPGLSLIGVDRDRIYSVEDVNVVPMTHVICGSWHTITYNASSQLYYKFGSGREFPRVMDVFLQSGIKVKSIECGDGVTYVLSTMNKLFYMNEPNPYEAGSIDIDDVLIPEQDIVGREIEYIKAGATFILVLTKEGYIYTKGENKRGQLGTADFKDRVRYI
jgi:alpha-tubulin suppressor-like RCC1 family protein